MKRRLTFSEYRAEVERHADRMLYNDETPTIRLSKSAGFTARQCAEKLEADRLSRLGPSSTGMES